jgi:hypothetical protein
MYLLAKARDRLSSAVQSWCDSLRKVAPPLEIELERELDDARIYTCAADDTECRGSEIVVGISELRVI